MSDATREIIVREGDKVALAAEVVEKIKEITQMAKQVAAAEAEMKAAILRAMEENGVERLDNEEAGMSIIYFPETETTTFDSKQFRAEMPDLYAEYCTKPRKTKAYVKIDVKEPKRDAGAAE